MINSLGYLNIMINFISEIWNFIWIHIKILDQRSFDHNIKPNSSETELGFLWEISQFPLGLIWIRTPEWAQNLTIHVSKQRYYSITKFYLISDIIKLTFLMEVRGQADN